MKARWTILFLINYTVYIASIKELVQQGNTSSSEWGLCQTQQQLQNRKLKRKRKNRKKKWYHNWTI